jgi:quercetin dioxygenase-like cupin family protein
MNLRLSALGVLAMLPAIAYGQTPAAPAEPSTATVLQTFDRTNAGQPIVLPQGPVQVVISRVTILAGASLPVHKHLFPRYAQVVSGRLRVDDPETGQSREFKPGDFIVEALDRWHSGTALGTEPVELLVIDQVRPGEPNTIRR